jgi:archaellum component FlaC
VGVLKTRKPKVPIWFQDFLENRFSKVENDICNLKIDIKNINKRLDNIVKLNNLKE